MPKQITITKEIVDQTAFELIRTQGMDALTARNIAQQVGCSTQPIYKLYRNLDELKEHVIFMMGVYMHNIIMNYDKTPIAFLNAGLGFIHFAATEKVLFRTFITENYLQNSIFDPLTSKALYGRMEELLCDAPLNDEERWELFFDTMVYTNGLAHLAYSGYLGMSEKQVAERLIGFFFQQADLEWEGELNL